MRRSVAVIFASALLAASCGVEPTEPARVGSDQADLGSLVASEVVAEPLQLPEIDSSLPELSAPGPRGKHPLTNRVITDGELLFMLPGEDDLGDLAAEFILDDAQLETNADVVRAAVQDRADEAGDVTGFGRVGGAHALFRPRLLLTNDGPLSEVDVWVALFESDEGASAYLADFATDAAKGIGAGRATHSIVLARYAFAVDPIADEAVAFTLDYRAPGESEEATESETLVGYRIGRLLVFTSVTHLPDGDFRLRAITLAGTVHERVLGVLRGTIRLPDPEPEPVPLKAYAFHYEQAVERSSVTAEVKSEGVVVLPDRFSCDVTLTVGPSVTTHRYVVVDDRVWFDYGDDDKDRFFETTMDASGVAQDLLYCPGWAVELDASGLDRSIKWAQPSLSSLDEVPVWSYRLGEPELVAAGVIPPNSGIDVDYFALNTSLDGPWVLKMDLDLSGRATTFVDAFGDDFGAKGRAKVEVRYRFEVGRINDAGLAVEPPSDE